MNTAPRPRSSVRGSGGEPSNVEALASALAPLVAERLGQTQALIDAEAAGKLLGVPKSWVLAEAREERIPHVRLGRYVRFERGALEAWWRERALGPRRRTGAQPASDGRNAL